MFLSEITVTNDLAIYHVKDHSVRPEVDHLLLINRPL